MRVKGTRFPADGGRSQWMFFFGGGGGQGGGVRAVQPHPSTVLPAARAVLWRGALASGGWERDWGLFFYAVPLSAPRAPRSRAGSRSREQEQGAGCDNCTKGVPRSR
jgi:hypothetical protein